MTLVIVSVAVISIFFFFNDTATTEIYTLSLHDALPILRHQHPPCRPSLARRSAADRASRGPRSEEHTSELQSLAYLVCRLLLEKKKTRHTLMSLLTWMFVRVSVAAFSTASDFSRVLM